MDKSTWVVVGLLGYLMLFMAAILAFTYWRRHKRGDRPPVEFKLLRGPGESLRRKIKELDEALLFQLGGASFVPLLASFCTLWILAKIQPHMPLWTGLAIICPVFLITAGICIYWVFLRFNSLRDYELGYLGEREVSESLLPLLAQGYQVFHDIPVTAGKRVFNLDHVVVGPSGLFLIETKTRRKGRARTGHNDHEVTYDGKQLIWPWAEDRHGLEQVLSEARWLTEWVLKMTGLKLEAKPILALPGWYVKATARGPVNVVNSKNLRIAIKGRGQEELTPEQIDLIARQLDARCRDVE
ncbi:MAG: NERD domain-containing protein [Cephaloticoccus sp.]|nr:NERD domain-containing protein [Cephaloticoccus sp.]